MRIGSYSTRFVGRYLGEAFPFYYVIEYPKSGGNWLSHMIADYIGLPFVERPIAPVLRSCVMHSHWGYDSRLRRVFYLVRDGRDVCVSAFFHVRRAYLAGTRADRAYVQRKFGELFSEDTVDLDATELLPDFIKLWATQSYGTRWSWGEHVRMWCSGHEHVALVKYEDLLADGVAALSGPLATQTGCVIDEGRLGDCVRRHSFENMSGRAPGQEDKMSFRRKGVAGDWRNHFTAASGLEFSRHFQPMLELAGYEQDASWVSRLGAA